MDRVSPRPNYFFIELLRCMAAIAVVIIHVLAPYRDIDIGSGNWLVAITFNVASRWAVPIFIMITGALMLADTRPFNLRDYLVHRCRKVVVPFVSWSVLYAFLAGLTFTFSRGFQYNFSEVWPLLKGALEEPTWYHLGFYYYFLPLYLVIPLLTPMVQRLSNDNLWLLTAGWLVLATLYFLRIDLPGMVNMVMYGGYLVFGYVLMRTPLNDRQRLTLACAASVALVIGIIGVWDYSTTAEGYAPGRFTSYKTINTALIAGTLFALVYRYADAVSGRGRATVAFISRYSLGLYLIHPLVLWPVRELAFSPAPTLLAIPLLVLVVTVISLGLVWSLSRFRATSWVVP